MPARELGIESDSLHCRARTPGGIAASVGLVFSRPAFRATGLRGPRSTPQSQRDASSGTLRKTVHAIRGAVAGCLVEALRFQRSTTFGHAALPRAKCSPIRQSYPFRSWWLSRVGSLAVTESNSQRRSQSKGEPWVVRSTPAEECQSRLSQRVHAFPRAAHSFRLGQMQDRKYVVSVVRNLAAERPEQLSSMMQGMVQELESMQAVYPVQAGRPLQPAIPQQ